MGWKSAISLGMLGAVAIEWDDLIVSMRAAGITICSNPDIFVWASNVHDGAVTASLAYDSLLKFHHSFQPQWWFMILWKKKVARKIKCFLWLTLQDKILSWDCLMRRGFQGPSRCCFCLKDLETTVHLFYWCPRFRYVWSGLCDHFQTSW